MVFVFAFTLLVLSPYQSAIMFETLVMANAIRKISIAMNNCFA